MLMEPPKTTYVPFVRRLEELKWTHDYLFNIKRLLLDRHSYTIFCCPHLIPNVEPGEEYDDVSSAGDERLTVLSPRLFIWLMNIHPGYVVLVIDKGIMIETYTPSHLPINWVMTSFMSGIQTLDCNEAVASCMQLGPGTSM